MSNALADDVEFFDERLKENDSQVWRRAYIRAFFAQIEGDIFRLKQIALNTSNLIGVAFSEAEIALIKEKSYELKDNGEVKTQTKYLRFQSNLRFAFKMFARGCNCSYELNVNNQGWLSLDKAFNHRNRLSHPKDMGDLNISDSDLVEVKAAFTWYRHNSIGLLRSAAQGLRNYVYDFTQRADKILLNPTATSNSYLERPPLVVVWN